MLELSYAIYNGSSGLALNILGYLYFNANTMFGLRGVVGRLSGDPF